MDFVFRLALMAVLLCCSFFFSASETALFHLSPRRVAAYASSTHKIEYIIWRLLQTPNRLLTSILFCNLLVNIIFISLAGVLTASVERQYGVIPASLWAFMVFLVLLLFGEMLPKTLAYSNTQTISYIAAFPFYGIVSILTPLLVLIDIIILKPTIRLTSAQSKPGKNIEPVSMNQLKVLLEYSTQKGVISQDENLLLLEVIELGMLKVRHVMIPRVEMHAFSIHTPNDQLQQWMHQYGIRQAPVYLDNIDAILGVIHLRDLLLNPGIPAEKLIKPVQYVPEQKTIESLIPQLQKTDELVVAVDEYGGIAGIISLDDIVDQLLGTSDEADHQEPVRQIGPMTYRLSSQLSIHDWSEAFGVDPEQIRMTTVGGLVTALLGRIPKPGDAVTWNNLKFTVETLRKNRIENIILTLEPMVSHD